MRYNKKASYRPKFRTPAMFRLRKCANTKKVKIGEKN